MNPDVPVAENAREYPQKYHWKVTTENEVIAAQIMESADLRRASADLRRASPEYRKPIPGIMTSTMQEHIRM